MVFTGIPVNFDSLLPVQDLTPKSCNKLLKVPNNNINMLYNVLDGASAMYKVCGLVVIGGLVNGQVL